MEASVMRKAEKVSKIKNPCRQPSALRLRVREGRKQ
jgi:hypothetical protein